MNSTNSESSNRQILRRTLVLMGVCGILTFVILAVRLYLIQIRDHDTYEGLAVEQQVRETTVTAARGTIYDSGGTVLAMSASVETVFISPNEIAAEDEDAELIAEGLSEILDVEADAIMEKIENTSSYYQTVKTKIEQELADEVRQFISDNDLSGIYLEPTTKRYYPYSSVASHVVGFVGTDNTGLDGIELIYNEYLTGTNGRIVRLKSATGTDMLLEDYEDFYDAEDGDDVYLTIDSNIQQIVEKYLEQAMEDYDVQNGGAAVAMDPNTGAILAMATMDNYDLNNYSQLSDEVLEEFSEIEDEEEYNEAVSEKLSELWRNKIVNFTYEPGSTFKPITFAMALEEGIVSLDDSYYCDGSVSVLGREKDVKCWKSGGHGSQTLTEALQHSCNVATVSIGLKVGADTFYDYVEAFGFLDKTGVDLPAEQLGIWWSDWDTYAEAGNLSSLAAASFGQTFTITPIQLVAGISAVVNGGYLMEPHIVEKIVDGDGTVTYSNEATAVRQVISEETSATMRGLLESVVGDSEEGTGRNAYVAGYRVGGKTGTSTDTTKEVSTGIKDYIVSFVGVAPADDPEIVLLVILDSPSKESDIYISGGQMAAPTVGNMLSEILPYMGIEADYTDEELTEVNIQVPYVTKENVTAATETLEDAGFSVRVVGDGDNVTAQMPAAGATVVSGTEVVIYAGEDKPETQVTVPDVTGMTYAEAKSALEGRGLFIRISGASASANNVIVLKQSVEAGEVVTIGDVVVVTLLDQRDPGEY